MPLSPQGALLFRNRTQSRLPAGEIAPLFQLSNRIRKASLKSSACGIPRELLPTTYPTADLLSSVELANLAAMSLAEIKDAVEALTPDEVAELASFIVKRDNAHWDQQIDTDFAQGGRLRPLLEEVREDIRAGRLDDLP